MSSFLINSLLSKCSDIHSIFDVLCWPGHSWPEIEKVEALGLLIGELLRQSQSDRERYEGFWTQKRVLSKVQSVVWDQCLPLLKMLSHRSVSSEEGLVAPNGERNEMLGAVCALLGLCLKECQADTAEKIAGIALPVLHRSGEMDATSCATDQLDTDVAIEVLVVLLLNLPSDAALTTNIISCTLGGVKQLSDTRVSKIIVRIWFTFLKSASKEKRADILHHIWEDLLGWHELEGTQVVAARNLCCLVALSDYFFALDQTRLGQQNSPGPEPLMSEPFFRVLQAGLIHRDSMSRKRALYLLKRCVSVAEARATDVDGILFKWTTDKSAELRKFWEDYTLILETLEEYQIHVVRPVFSRIDRLVDTAATNTQGETLIHPAWLLCVYQRMFHSENQVVIKEGVSHLLGLHMLQHPPFALAFSQFIIGPFLDVLAETSLYHRSPGQAVGNCPELGQKLQSFLVTFFGALPEDKRDSALLHLLQHVGSRHWCAVPLLFLSKALSHLTPCPLLKPDGLHVLRQVLRCTMLTHQGLLRRATKNFLLHTSLHLSDVSTTSLDEVFAFIAQFQTEESLWRGTPLWEKLCDWLMANEGIFRPAEASASPPRVSVHCFHRLKAFLSVPASLDHQPDSISGAADAELLACALLLSADLNERKKKEQGPEDSSLEQLLLPLLDVLRRLNTSVYLPLTKTDKSLQLMLGLLQLLDRKPETGMDKEDTVAFALRELLFLVAEPVQEFILRRLSGELQSLCDIGRVNLYLSLLRVLIRTYSSVPGYLSNLHINFVSSLTANCLRILSEPCEQTSSVARHVQKAVSMATLAFLCETAEQHLVASQSDAMRAFCSLTAYFYSSLSSSSTPRYLNQTLPKPLASTSDISESSQPDDSPKLKDWGRVVSNFIRDQWICRNFLQKFANVPSDTVTFQAAIDALSLLPSDLVLPVLDYMCSALPQVIVQKEELCLEAVSVSWKLVQALSNNAHDFWPSLRAFVHLAFHHDVLKLKGDLGSKVTACIQQITCELMALSQTKPRVLNVLIQHCCHTWRSSSLNKQTDTIFKSSFNHLDILTEACVYGPILRKDQRLIQDVQTYVEQLGEEFALSENKDDHFPRLCVLSFLSHLEPSNSLHQELMQKLVQCLLKKDKDISKSSVRYYSNSMQHRIKNRVWQTMLLLLPKLKQDFVAECVYGAVCEAGFCSNQASVKYLIEWALIMILYQNPSQIQHFWVCFSVDQEKTKTSICTFLSVLVHLHLLLPKLEDKTRHWQKAVEVILRWCFSHNFTVRLYALVALKRVWALERLRTDNEQGNVAPLQGLVTVVEACLHQAEAMQNTGNAKKNWSRIQEHFFFSAFHPVNDYSIETIFHTFPSLSELADDECIPVWKFEKLVDFQHSCSLPLKNAGSELRELQPGDWVQQNKDELEQDTCWADVQKKIDPWTLSLHEQESPLLAQHRAARVGKLTSGLLVVASLIEKPTNLGGLCRTCEIFGASALVLSSLHHIRDKQFQALSVSSELWLPMFEVRPFDLSNYLQLKQREGYNIIGVEQTANSQSLKDYRFPEKTLLLLGNEREGIPADLLQLLDVCVEIPQQGVTRSLNVHVSAALLVWEYTRQHLGSDQAS